MADDGPKLWAYRPHTNAKHRILESYLKAWSVILANSKSTQVNKILFVDGFAGPGEHLGGEPGSPVLVSQAIREHTGIFPIPVDLVFIEKRQDRFEHLKGVLQPIIEDLKLSSKQVEIKPRCGDCFELISRALDDRERTGRPFGPALVFLDQFGYGAVPMDLIRRIMAHPMCEVFTYLNCRGFIRWLPDSNKDQTRTQTFGSERWREARDLRDSKRIQFLLNLYSDQLRSYGGSKFVWDFAMADSNDSLIYWLFFCTNNLRGLEEMKRAMRRVDAEGGYRFSDARDPNQLFLLSGYDDEWLAAHLKVAFAGRKVSIGQIRTHVVCNTPMVSYAAVLGKLERTGVFRDRSKPKIAYSRELDEWVEFA